jgi:hypothetical protein
MKTIFVRVELSKDTAVIYMTKLLGCNHRVRVRAIPDTYPNITGYNTQTAESYMIDKKVFIIEKAIQ